MTRPDNPNPAPWQTVHPTTPVQILEETPDMVPLGQQFLRAGLITQGQLAQALREQRENFLKFGEVCLIHQWVSIEELYKHTASHLLSLGEILIALQYIDIDQLKLALSQQRRFGRKLGEILLWKAWVTEDHLTYSLRVQQHLRQLAAPNAWQALQEYLAAHPDIQQAAETATGNGANPNEIPLDGTSTGEFDLLMPPPLLGKTPPQNGGESTSPSQNLPIIDVEKLQGQLNTYRNKVAALELQLEMQQQEWNALSSQMSQQVADYQAQYEGRIQELEQSIHRSHADVSETTQLRHQLEQLQTELELFQGYEQKYQLLIKQQQTQTQEITQSRFRIQQLEGELRLTQISLHEAERALQNHQGLVQFSEEQRQRIKQLETDFQGLRLIEQEYQQLQQLQDPLLQEMDLMRSQIDVLQMELQTAQQTSQDYQELLQHSAALTAERDTLVQQIQEWQEQAAANHHETSDALEMEQTIVSLRAERDRLAHEVDDLRGLPAEITALQSALTAVSTERETLVQQVATLTAQIAGNDQSEEVATLQAALVAFQTERDALLKQLEQQAVDVVPPPDDRRYHALTGKYSQSQELIVAYRRSLEALQRDVDDQKHQNRCLQARLEQQEAVLDIARLELRSSTSISRRLQSRLDAERSGREIDQALHWGKRVLKSLQEAALVTEDDITEIMVQWQQEGKELSRVIQERTKLDPMTIKFFSDEGYLARLLGCRRIGEYLRAAGLVTEADVEEAMRMVPPGTRIGEALAEKGMLNPATADYFAKTFTQST